MTDKRYTLGSRELDRMLQGILKPGNLIILAGHPGTGKSLMASMIAYNNASIGNKVLYVKIGRKMDREIASLAEKGFDLKELISEGLVVVKYYKYIREKTPAVTLLEDMVKQVKSADIDMVIIDTLTPIYHAVSGDPLGPTLLYNELFTIVDELDKLMLILIDLPKHRESRVLQEISPMSDAVIILRREEERGFTVNKLKITKGAYIPYSSIVYSIRYGKGLTIYPPLLLDQIPGLRKEKKFRMLCRTVSEFVGDVYGGEIVYAEYPVGMLPHRLLVYMLGVVRANKSKMLVISYWYPPSQVREIFYKVVRAAGVSGERLGFIDRNIVYEGFNPSAMSLEELYSLELELIDKSSPDVVLFLGMDTYHPYLQLRYVDLLRNQLLYLRKKGILSFRMAAEVNKEFSALNAALADIYVKYQYTEKEGRFTKTMYLMRKGREPLIISEAQMEECFLETLRELYGEERKT